MSGASLIKDRKQELYFECTKFKISIILPNRYNEDELDIPVCGSEDRTTLEVQIVKI